MNPLEWGARRRQNELERRAQDAFLAEIAENWQPSTRSQRRLMARSSLTHLRERAVGGGPTMAAVAMASVPTAVGSALLAFAPQTHRVDYRAGAQAWASVVLTLGLFGLIFELFRSPRTVHVRRLTVLAALPLAFGSIDGVFSLHWRFEADRILMLAFLIIGVGMLGIVATNGFVHSRRARPTVRASLRVVAVGCLVTACGDYPWGWMYLRDQDQSAAAGCFCAAAGAVLISLALFRAQPEVTA